MSNHLAQTRHRDRLARCVLAFAPRGALASQRAGWVPTGAPGFPRRGGVVLDGAADNLTKALGPHLVGINYFSFHIEFTPKTVAGDGLSHYWFDTDNANRFYCRKQTDGVLRVRTPAGSILDVALVDYEDYWVTGGRNVLSVHGENGQRYAWLNSHAIGNSSSSLAMAGAAQTIYLGSSNVPNSQFDGAIRSVRLYDSPLTEADHLAAWRGAA